MYLVDQHLNHSVTGYGSIAQLLTVAIRVIGGNDHFVLKIQPLLQGVHYVNTKPLIFTIFVNNIGLDLGKI